jgi:HEAT repeat protein
VKEDGKQQALKAVKGQGNLDGKQQALKAVKGQKNLDGKQQALKAIKSGSVPMRRSSVLLLGKFEDEVSMTAVLGAVSDSDASVRHAALTAINEYLMVSRSLFVLVLKQENQKTKNQLIKDLFRLIGDSDIDNRRLASRLVFSLGLSVGFRVEFLPKDIQSEIKERFEDSDEQVRFNLYYNYTLLRKLVPADILLKGLADKSHQVRMEALEKLVYYERDFAWRNLEHLLAIDDEESRVFVMKSFSTYPPPASQVSLFKTLMNDPNPLVSAYAMYGLVRRKHYPSISEFDQVIGRLKPADHVLARNLIYSVAQRSEFNDWLKEKYKDQDFLFYSVVLGIYMQHHRQELSVDQLLKYLGSSNENISTTASYILSNRKCELNQLLPLVDSDYTHTRENLINISYRLPKKDQAELLSLLILDDDPTVQVQALRLYGRLRLPDYLVYAEGALSELENRNLVSVALQIFVVNRGKLIQLIQSKPEFRKNLKQAIRVCPWIQLPREVRNQLENPE